MVPVLNMPVGVRLNKMAADTFERRFDTIFRFLLKGGVGGVLNMAAIVRLNKVATNKNDRFHTFFRFLLQEGLGDVYGQKLPS